MKVPGMTSPPAFASVNAQPPDIAQAELLLNVNITGAASAPAFKNLRRARRLASALPGACSVISLFLDPAMTYLLQTSLRPPAPLDDNTQKKAHVSSWLYWLLIIVLQDLHQIMKNICYY